MHVRLGDVFDDDGDIEFPDPHRLVVRGAHEPPVLVDKSDGVDGPQVLVILLHDVTAVDIKLVDFLVGAAGQEQVLLVCIRIELDTVLETGKVSRAIKRHELQRTNRNLVVWRESRNALARFRVPQLDHLVVARRKELCPVVGKGDVPDALGMAKKSAQTSSLVVAVPQFDLAIHTATQQHMATVGKESNSVDPFRMARPKVKGVSGISELA